MKNNKHKYGFYLLGGALALTCAMAYFHGTSTTTNVAANLKISDFAEGTHVDYAVFSGGEALEQKNNVIIGKSGLEIPIPKNSKNYDAESLLSYRLKVHPPKNEAETLEMLVTLDQKSGDIDLSGSGLDEFSKIEIDKGETVETLSSDWSGLFSGDNINSLKDENGDPKHSGLLKMAFQNSGIDSDISKLGDGQMEVFFGDSSADDRNDVQRRYSFLLISEMRTLSTLMAMQTHIIGMFFDASIQLRTQRKMQELQARAHKDYHPSEHMCRVGTFMRSLAHSESKSDLDKHALNKILMDQYLGHQGSSGAGGPGRDEAAQIKNYLGNYCHPVDSDGKASAICPAPAATDADLIQRNKDIDYARTLAAKLTVEVDFADGTGTGGANTITEEERDIVALARNLYFPTVFNAEDKKTLEIDFRGQYAARSYAAKMNVAHSSFVNIVGMKSSAPEGQPTTATTTAPVPPPLGTGVRAEQTNYTPPPPSAPSAPPAGYVPLGAGAGPGGLQSALVTTRTAPVVLTEDAGWAYMKAMFREFGIVDTDGNGDGDTVDPQDFTVEEQIDVILGERPSYYAQMEVLTKKIYQHPNFFTNLYDKPANVDRIGASLDAIHLMNQRDRFESMLRREMVSAILVEHELDGPVQDVSSRMYQSMYENQREQ